jgi:formamidopyrimidine-DNA glycosylase
LDAGADELRFVDARRFGRVLICDPRSMHRRFGPKQLGPDAMRVAVSDLTARLAKTRRKIKAALLEQRLIAGIGNIYADEILFAARVCPTTPAFRLDPDAVARIDRAMRTVLNRALRHGGTTIRDYVSGDGAPGNFQNYLAVYGRAKQPCKKCSTPIELTRTIVSGRATYWCPTCQAARK